MTGESFLSGLPTNELIGHIDSELQSARIHQMSVGELEETIAQIVAEGKRNAKRYYNAGAFTAQYLEPYVSELEIREGIRK